MTMAYRQAILTGLAAAVLLCGYFPALAEEGDARDLVKRVLEAVPKESFTATLTVTSIEGEERKLEMNRKYIDGVHGSYLEVVSPEELEGIRFLFLESPAQPNEQYIKVKASRQAVRVSEDVRRQPFLGSAFYVSDLVLPDLDDYTYEFVGEDEVGGRKTRLVAMTPKSPDEELYAKTILALDPEDLLIMRREFFDAKGDKLKVWTILKVEKIDDIWTLTEQEMADVKEKAKSRLDVSEIRYNVELPEMMFTPKYLLR